MSFANDDEHRKALAKLFGARGANHTSVAPSSPAVAPLTPATPGVQPVSAAAILQRLRQKQTPPLPDPLRIVEKGEGGLGIGRFKIGQSWWVRFNRDILDEEHEKLDAWCKANCARGYRQTHPDRYTFHDEDDSMLFRITFA